jgi:DNA polymerase
MVVTLAEMGQEASSCVRCRLSAGRTHVVFGEGAPHAGLLVVGEGPGRDEDLQGRPFVGRSGQLLDRLLIEELGMARSECYIANVVKCRPPGNRDPLPDEIEACRPWLEAQVSLIAPRVVLTLGNFSTRLLLGTSEGIRRTRGRTYTLRDGIALVPTYHPAAALRGGGEVLAEMRADLVRAKDALLGRQGRPDVVAGPRAGRPGARTLESGRGEAASEAKGSGGVAADVG